METVVNSLLEEHFQFFDRCIREVLQCHGIAYEPESAYYNDVFFRVYEHVFSPATLKKFDPAGRSFRAWLAAVARNAVLDWIKSSHPSFPIKRGAEAQSETIRAGRTLSLDAPADENSLPLAQRVAAPEIIEHDGQTYMASLLPSLKGIRIAKMECGTATKEVR